MRRLRYCRSGAFAVALPHEHARLDAPLRRRSPAPHAFPAPFRSPSLRRTPQGDIRVLGTSFVIRVGEEEVRTTVLRSSVSGGAERPGLLRVLGTRDPVTAEANEEIILNQEGASVVPIAADVIPRRLAWQDGMLTFDGETLKEAIAEVSRQAGWRFELADPALGELRVGGYVSAEPEAFIELMSSSLGLEARRAGDRHVVLNRRAAH